MVKNIVLATVLLLVIWAGSFGIAFGVTEWRGKSGPAGPQGVAGPPGPIAAPDYCSAVLGAGFDSNATSRDNYLAMVKKYCP